MKLRALFLLLPLLAVGMGLGIPIRTAHHDPALTFYQDFVGSTTLMQAARRGPTLTFGRDSTAWYFDSDGDLVSASSNVPRFDHDFITGIPRGFLYEEARTNSIRNNTMVGAVEGTPGTLPNKWVLTANGVSTEVTELGTFNNIDYINVRFFGTPTGDPVIWFEDLQGIDAVSGENWTESVYLSKNGGSFSNINVMTLVLSERNEAGGFEKSNLNSDIKGDLTAILQRFEYSATLSDLQTAHVVPGIVIRWTSGVIDVTLRFGLPQAEETNMTPGFASSVIKTTDAGVVARNGDSLQTTSVDWYNPEGTFLFDGSTLAINQSADQHMLQIDDGGPTNLIEMYLDGSTDDVVFETLNDAGTDGLVTASGIVAGQNFAFIASFTNDDIAASLGGATIVTDATADHPIASTFTVFQVGVNSGAVLHWNGHVRRIKFWNVDKANSSLQSTTAAVLEFIETLFAEAA